MKKFITTVILAVLLAGCNENNENDIEKETFSETAATSETTTVTTIDYVQSWLNETTAVTADNNNFAGAVRGELRYIGAFSEGLAEAGFEWLDENGNSAYGYILGYMDESGEIVIEPQFYPSYNDLGATVFSEGLAAARGENSKWGFIDKTGETVVPFEYEYAFPFSEGVARVLISSSENKWGLIDKSGEIIAEIEYQWVGKFHEGLAIARDENWKEGFIDKTGKLVIPCIYDEVGKFSDGLCPVGKQADHEMYYDMKWGFIDKTGKTVIPFEYGYAESFSEGLAGVVNFDENWDERKVGFIDKTGKLVIPFTYSHLSFKDDYHGGYADFPRFSEGLAKFDMWNNGFFYISKTGEVVISIEDIVRGGDFHEGVAWVRRHVPRADGRTDSIEGYINKNGEFVLPLEYEEVNDFSGGYAAVCKDGEWKVIYIGDIL